MAIRLDRMDAAQQNVHARLMAGEPPQSIFDTLVRGGWAPQTANALIASVRPQEVAPIAPAAPGPAFGAASFHPAASTVPAPAPAGVVIGMLLNGVILLATVVLMILPFIGVHGPRDVVANAGQSPLPIYFLVSVPLWITALVLFILANRSLTARGARMSSQVKTRAVVLLVSAPVLSGVLVALIGILVVVLGIMCGEAVSATCGM